MAIQTENPLIERALWRRKALAKIEEVDLDRANSTLKEFPLDSLIMFAYFSDQSRSFLEIEKHLSEKDVENLEHLPIHTMAWILAMEDEGYQVTINTHKQGSLKKEDYPYLHSIYLTVKTENEVLAVSPIDPWNERFANLGDQLLAREK